ncbi:3-oxoacyl-ACP reductase FabG [Nucisporomicrobium flavum]|uniref:3-oxoacyl-ACP reductase FabG n=1 Tax=Nucisporomicrobium flavum TaxID=2785915 RepID=UPI0018F4D807|nr:3-oxoacyl-ACP reductase FabG [Nucisporomicrobium flavum]
MGRTALVVGGARGIGLATAHELVKDGHRVAVTYRDSAPPPDIFAVRCDVADTASVDEAFARVERELSAVEIVVVAAGVTRDKLLMRMNDEDFADVLDTNLTGAFRVAKRASRAMVRARWGRLIFISSAVALRGEAGQANYAASKAGLIGFARSLTRELGSRNITANVVAPGYTETDMTASLTEDQREHMRSQVPLGRAAQPEEIAAAVSYVASDRAGYVSGAIIPVDGGAGMGH